VHGLLAWCHEVLFVRAGFKEENRNAAILEAFERAITLSPSSAFTLFAGSASLAYAGEAERAIEWAERALRISPNDRLNYFAYHALALAHFLRARYTDAAGAARRSVNSNPGFSVSHSLLVAPLVRLGSLEEANAETAQVLSLQPSFSARGFCTALALPATLADPLAKAWREAGLPP
jgi:tetratricopeptide (TPR) repeat protein